MTTPRDEAIIRSMTTFLVDNPHAPVSGSSWQAAFRAGERFARQQAVSSGCLPEGDVHYASPSGLACCEVQGPHDLTSSLERATCLDCLTRAVFGTRSEVRS